VEQEEAAAEELQPTAFAARHFSMSSKASRKSGACEGGPQGGMGGGEQTAAVVVCAPRMCERSAAAFVLISKYFCTSKARTFVLVKHAN
jgi:hypothetical protein